MTISSAILGGERRRHCPSQPGTKSWPTPMSAAAPPPATGATSRLCSARGERSILRTVLRYYELVVAYLVADRASAEVLRNAASVSGASIARPRNWHPRSNLISDYHRSHRSRIARR